MPKVASQQHKAQRLFDDARKASESGDTVQAKQCSDELLAITCNNDMDRDIARLQARCHEKGYGRPIDLGKAIKLHQDKVLPYSNRSNYEIALLYLKMKDPNVPENHLQYDKEAVSHLVRFLENATSLREAGETSAETLISIIGLYEKGKEKEIALPRHPWLEPALCVVGDYYRKFKPERTRMIQWYSAAVRYFNSSRAMDMLASICNNDDSLASITHYELGVLGERNKTKPIFNVAMHYIKAIHLKKNEAIPAYLKLRLLAKKNPTVIIPEKKVSLREAYKEIKQYFTANTHAYIQKKIQTLDNKKSPKEKIAFEKLLKATIAEQRYVVWFFEKNNNNEAADWCKRKLEDIASAPVSSRLHLKDLYHYAGIICLLAKYYRYGDTIRCETTANYYYQCAAQVYLQIAQDQKNNVYAAKAFEKLKKLKYIAPSTPDIRDKIGDCYQYGQGVPANMELAIREYGISSLKGSAHAAAMLRKLPKMVTPSISSPQFSRQAGFLSSRRQSIPQSINQSRSKLTK